MVSVIKEIKDTTTQDIIFILDESGSMFSMGKEPIQAVNNFINEQRKVLGNDGATFSLWTFNTKVTKVFDDMDLQDVPEFKEYNPDNMTALYDAIGHAITTKKQKGKYHDVISVILTDGQENASVEFQSKEIRKMIKDMEDNYGWKFIYLGANQDVFAVGDGIGVNANCCAQFECEPGQLNTITCLTSSAVAKYRKVSSQMPSGSVSLSVPSMRHAISAAAVQHRKVSSQTPSGSISLSVPSMRHTTSAAVDSQSLATITMPGIHPIPSLKIWN
jgi:hypothetical protein